MLISSCGLLYHLRIVSLKLKFAVVDGHWSAYKKKVKKSWFFFESLLRVYIDHAIGQSTPLEWAGMYITVTFPSSSALMLALAVLWDTV